MGKILIILWIFCKILYKNLNSTYEFTLKEGSKVKMEDFLGTKSWRNFLEGLKWNVDIFKGLKTYLTHNIKYEVFSP